jgi:hypothetical protein
LGNKLTAMHGVLKPVPDSRDAYSQITPLQDNGYYSTAQYAQPSQPPQVQQPDSWPAPAESPYYPSTGAYGTPSAQHSSQHNNGAYATPEQPSSASQAPQYPGYDPSSDPYTYPDPAQTTPYPQKQAAPSEDPVSPNQDSAQKNDRTTYGLRYQNTVHDLDELMGLLQAEVDAAAVNGVHECVKSELSLGGNAFVPLMRPNIGPYADGGNQDLPADFKKNFTADIAKEKKASDEEDRAETQTQSQDTSQQLDDAHAAQPENGTSEAQQSASTSTPQQTPNKPAVPEPEDPLKNCPNATVDCILNIADTDVRAIIQRAASRGLVQRIVNMDGFKYMFNNFWTSRVDGDGLRFSYICRDSLQNKDRFAHVPARPTTAAPSQLRAAAPRRTKESWDCKGSISIKFSQAVGAIIIQYRHAAIHPTHASRKRPPRKSAGTPRATGVRGPGRPRGTAGTKRKRSSDATGATGAASAAASLPQPLPYAAQYARPAAKEPSLFDLLQQSAIESAANEDGGQLGDTSKPWWSIT